MRNALLFVALAALVVLVYLFVPFGSESRIIKGGRGVKDWPGVYLVDPEEAPAAIREEVMHGFRLMIETQKYAAAYVGNRLNCTNCHFEGGNALGGPNGSISLVGVPYVYPKYSERSNSTIDLADRINNCFQRSLNGRPMEKEAPEMKAILTYLEWISRPVKGREEFPWLGLPSLVGEYKADPKQGELVYKRCCAICHGDNGQGTTLERELKPLEIPPLFGDGSFNDGAGMNRIEMIAPFVYLNMPYQDPLLTEQEALDVSQYVIEQLRPKFHAPVH